MKANWFLIPIVLASVAGCQPTKTPSGGEAEATPPSNAIPDSKPIATTPKEPELSQVPDSLKSPAYHLYGLENETSPTFELSGGPSGFKSGAYEMKLVEVTDGSAVFRQSWTGALASDLGSSDYKVTKEGIYALTVGDKKLDPPQLELPADPKAGFRWETNSKFELPGASINSSTMRIVGMEKIKVKMGTYDTLVVKAQILGSQNNKPLLMGMTVYYAKNFGPVKIVITGKDSNGKPIISTLQATKMP